MTGARKALAGGVLGAALLSLAAPAAPAAAYCQPLVYALTGRCTTACAVAGQPYTIADRAAGDALPDVECPA